MNVLCIIIHRKNVRVTFVLLAQLLRVVYTFSRNMYYFNFFFLNNYTYSIQKYYTGKLVAIILIFF